MNSFKGFTNSETFTQVPDSFFRLLKELKDTDELKVTLYAIWWIDHTEGPFRALCETDFDAEKLGLSAEEISYGLEKTVQRGSLLRSQHEADVFYFLNSPRGRAASEAFAKGEWRESGRIMSAPIERPNIFKLYEENIGPLTPLIADALKDAEQTYSADWITEAIELAVKNNKRNWKYCEAILKRWKEEGRAEKQDRRDAEKDRRRYIEGEFADYIEH
jgi:DnaD/phage-associated family protein